MNANERPRTVYPTIEGVNASRNIDMVRTLLVGRRSVAGIVTLDVLYTNTSASMLLTLLLCATTSFEFESRVLTDQKVDTRTKSNARIQSNFVSTQNGQHYHRLENRGHTMTVVHVLECTLS